MGGTVTSDITVTAYFGWSYREYTISVTVNNPDYGSVSPSSTQAPYGAIITISSSSPTKLEWYLSEYPEQMHRVSEATPTPSTEQYAYVFDSWTVPAWTVTGDVTITANFTRHVSYNVTFAVNNAEFGSVQYGSLWI